MYILYILLLSGIKTQFGKTTMYIHILTLSLRSSSSRNTTFRTSSRAPHFGAHDDYDIFYSYKTICCDRNHYSIRCGMCTGLALRSFPVVLSWSEQAHLWILWLWRENAPVSPKSATIICCLFFRLFQVQDDIIWQNEPSHQMCHVFSLMKFRLPILMWSSPLLLEWTDFGGKTYFRANGPFFSKITFSKLL